MSKNEYRATKTSGKFLSWVGRYMFLFLVVSLILTAVTIANADPSISEYRGNGEVQSYQFTLTETSQVQFFIGFDTSRDSTFVVLQVDDSVNATSPRTEFISVAVEDFYSQNLELPAGVYNIEVQTGEGVSYWMGYAKLNIGLILVTVVLWVIFTLLATIFFTVLPFWLMIALIELLTSASRSPDRGPMQQTVAQPAPQAAPPTRAVQEPPRGHTRAKFAENTQFEKLTRNDWIMLGLAVMFFVGYISNPFDNGFSLFLAIALGGSAYYNYTEREKIKTRLTLLLEAYPRATIAFMAEQLDKKEDYLVDVLRIMILDEGAPIRLDLVNRTVARVGSTGEPIRTEQARGPIVQASAPAAGDSVVVTPEPVQEPVAEPVAEPTPAPTYDDDTEIVEGEAGSVRQPWAYCQACGEGLKKKVKYCYTCGARQYDS